jgi:signal transduction histidine kinase
LNLEIQPLDLAALARTRCTQLAPLAARRQVQLAVTGLPAAWALGDPDRLSQVLNNLLDNAIRYSPPGATVSVEIGIGMSPTGPGSASPLCLCAVHDRGPGIAAQQLPLIFDRFYRTDTSRNRQTGGAGLGLAIVRALVLAQGGQVSAESVEGQGTTIHFSIPACQDCHQTDRDLTHS